MNTEHHRLAKQFFNRGYDELHEAEAQAIALLAQRKSISRDTNAEFEKDATFGERIADKVASFGGSWPFIGLFLGFILGWIGLNSILLARSNGAFDPYPYIMLNLVLSMVAALQAPVIMMSQNRQSAKDRLDAAHDYEINLKAELEILSLHEKVDALRTEQWKELVAIQQEQIQMLLQLVNSQAGLSAPPAGAPAPPAS